MASQKRNTSIDIINTAADDIKEYLAKYNDNKFTVIFTGEFFITATDKIIDIDILKDNLPECTDSCEAYGNKIKFYINNKWLRDKLKLIQESECRKDNIEIYSQARRLQKQLEFGLTGDVWTDDMYELARLIAYMLHTKSVSIRKNIVKQAATVYNNLQRDGKVNTLLVEAYRNALCIIS